MLSMLLILSIQHPQIVIMVTQEVPEGLLRRIKMKHTFNPYPSGYLQSSLELIFIGTLIFPWSRILLQRLQNSERITLTRLDLKLNRFASFSIPSCRMSGKRSQHTLPLWVVYNPPLNRIKIKRNHVIHLQ